MTGLVAISLLLTWFIWYNPSNFARQQSSNVTVQKATKTTNEAVERNTFLPTEALWQGSNQKYQLIAKGNGVPAQARTKLAKWQVTKVGPVKQLSVNAYNHLLTLPQSLQLTYQGSVSWSLIRTLLFKRTTKAAANYVFDRIVFDTRNQRTYLVNDYHETVRPLSIKQPNYGAIADLLGDATTKYAVTEQRFDHHEVALLDQSIAVTPQTYLIDKQSATHYIALLMTDNTSTSAVDTKQIGNQTVYTVNSNQRLAVDKNDSLMQYEDFAAAAPATSYRGVLRAAFTSLSSLSFASKQGIRYFGYNTQENAVTFRTYVRGVPVFNQTSNGTVRVVHNTSSKRIEFSGSNLEAAIPTSQTAVKLPAGQDVLNKLASMGAQPSDIDDLTVAYKWERDTNSGLVVNLTPTYYVNINGTFVDYNDLLSGKVALSTLINSDN
ncbi:hypothetical protein FD19_GL001351 [Lacticaseibacillus thailandensis DSM 22698 = JCM 13996]|uniref:Regulatory protein YycH domain-containing protein n=1 Tax=Lacticaseibacillus thailandensis DSM 22698 = JCM 13996 TaxID=1423810 RepID=A0A0R2C630_9LACO|nr:hypothetical protein FD19_GL001351 [Lacticaseibacillus thailandensis DSM 22698 = JCM 13996]